MKKVMIVDDEIMVRVGLRSIIDWGSLGYHIVCDAVNGQDALNKIEEHHPDVIFTDLAMKPVNGLELMERCKEKGYRQEFVILSAYNDFENVKKAMKLGATDYILKLTVSPEELKKVLFDLDKKIKTEQNPEELSGLVYKNIPAIKTRLIRSIIEKSCTSKEEVMREFSLLGLKIDLSSPFAVLNISIDNYGQNPRRSKIKEVQLMHFALENIITEVLQRFFPAEGFINWNGSLLFLIAVGRDYERDFPLFQKLIKTCFSSILEYTQRYQGVSVTGVLSEICLDLKDLASFVDASQDFLEYRAQQKCGILHLNCEDIREEIRSAKEYILSHLDQELNVTLVAKNVNLSPSYFSHLFKECVKISFVDYVNQLRIQRACSLLSNSNLKLYEIAQQIGFSNYNYFCSLFKKLMGVSPAEYRWEA